MKARLDHRLLFEEGADAMLVLTVGGDVLDANRKARRILWRTLEYLKGTGRDDLFDPADPRLEPAFEQLWRTGEFEGELCLLGWGGAFSPAEVSMTGFGDGLVSVVFRDATGRKQAEEEARRLREELEERVAERPVQLEKLVSKLMAGERLLRESEKRFRRTFEQAAVGIAHVAPDGGWLAVNQKLCEIVGYSREELLGKSFQDITHPDDLERDLEHARQLLAREIDEYSREKRYLRKDGSVVWIGLSVSLACDEEDRPGYFISVVEDITKRKRREEHLRSLTPQELEVLRLVARGYTNKRIAQVMHFSESTAKTNVQHIVARLGVSNRSEAAARAVEMGLTRAA